MKQKPILLAVTVAVLAGVGYAKAQSAQPAPPPRPDQNFPPPVAAQLHLKEGKFDHRNIYGRWHRESPFQTFSDVKGGANEFQREIEQGNANLNRDTGLKYHEPKFTPAGKAAFDKNIPSYGLRITAPRLGNDPQGQCDPWGVPRMLNGQVAGPHSAFEIWKLPDRVIWFSPWHHDMRMVWTDNRKLPAVDDVDPKWNGYSVGAWQGDTFVVNSIGFDERTWLDHNGYPHTDQMKLEERYRLLDADTLEMTEVVTDPEYYSEPFKSDVKIWKRDNVAAKEWDEQIYCVASEEGKFNRLIRDGGIGK